MSADELVRICRAGGTLGLINWTPEGSSARFDSPEAFRDYFKANYGPTIAVYRGLAEYLLFTASVR